HRVSDMEMMKKRFSKLLLGEDMSGVAKVKFAAKSKVDISDSFTYELWAADAFQFCLYEQFRIGYKLALVIGSGIFNLGRRNGSELKIPGAHAIITILFPSGYIAAEKIKKSNNLHMLLIALLIELFCFGIKELINAGEKSEEENRNDRDLRCMRNVCAIEREKDLNQLRGRYISFSPDRQQRFICRIVGAPSDPCVSHEEWDMYVSSIYTGKKRERW
ncbi:catalase active site-containing protein, partial [Tanacetum coccineum]